MVGVVEQRLEETVMRWYKCISQCQPISTALDAAGDLEIGLIKLSNNKTHE